MAISLNNLAGLLREYGKLQEAEPLYQQALSIDEKGFVPTILRWPPTPTTLLGCSTIGRLQKAEAFAVERCRSWKELCVEDIPVATSLNGLAGLLQRLQAQEGEPLYQRALSIDEKRAWSRTILRWPPHQQPCWAAWQNEPVWREPRISTEGLCKSSLSLATARDTTSTLPQPSITTPDC